MLVNLKIENPTIPEISEPIIIPILADCIVLSLSVKA